MYSLSHAEETSKVYFVLGVISSNCYPSVPAIVLAPPARALKARVCGNIRVFARALLKNLSFTAQVCLSASFENQADAL